MLPASPETVRRYARLWRAEAEAALAAERHEAQRVRRRLPEVAAILCKEHGARRVGYFGSLITGRLTPTSDVDLYVDRLRAGAFFTVVDRLWVLLGRPVDLVELDFAPASLGACIEREGVELRAR